MFEIKKSADRDFIVLNLTDFNVNDEELAEGSRPRKILEGTVKELVERVKPDYITFSGDFSYAHLKHNYETLGKLIDSYKIPWSFVWGNHDDEGVDHEGGMDALADIMLKNKYCMFEKGDAELGSGNYAVKVTEDEKTVYAFIFMDSHNLEVVPGAFDDNGNPARDWGRLHKNQLEWFDKTSRELGVKNTLITHIPIYAFRTAFAEAFNSEYNKNDVVFEDNANEKYWNEGYKGSSGVCYENICSYPIDYGELEAIKSSGNTELFLCGHDHINNLIIDYKGTKFVYALKTGCGCYWDKRMNGGTKLVLGKDGIKVEHIYVDSDKFTE